MNEDQTVQESLPAMPKPLIEWVVDERPMYQRGLVWYGIATVVVVGLFTHALWRENYVFAVILVLASLVFVILDNTAHRQLAVAITGSGLQVDEVFYAYRDVKSFYIIYQPQVGVKRLYFEFTGVRPRLGLGLADQNPLDIRDILGKYVVEDLEQVYEPTSDIIARWLRL